jgi:hypothetical protein
MKTMSSLAKIVRTLAIAVGIATAGMATSAHAATCGITGSATASPAVYDPFNPSGLATTTVTLNLTRINGGGGEKTDKVNFFLKSSSAAADGMTVVPISTVIEGNVNGLNLDIFYDFNEAAPIYAPTTVAPSSGNRFLQLVFTGNNVASDTAQVTFNISLPANLNLNAATSLPLNAVFSCSTTGGGSPTQQTGQINNAVVFPVTVLSALRTYYAGTDLAFGEIGNIPPVPLSPVRTNPANYIFVQSSGAFTVELKSQNAFKMKKPGAVTVGDEVRYSLTFLGNTRSTATTPTPNAIAISHQCMRAGLATAGQTLPIQATLIDGGQGKNPSPSYTDILTVTITPLAYSVAGTDDCGDFDDS